MSEYDQTQQPPPSETNGAAVSPPPPPVVVVTPKKSRVGVFFLGALSGCLVLIIGGALIGLAVASMRGGSSSSDFSFSTQKIAIVTIEGEILDSRDTIDAIHRYANNSVVRGIVMRINSPGGAIAPSQEIYSEILKTKRRSGKPFIASLDSVAASGGFYIASACDQIVTNPGSITGSIGVILQWMDIKDLLQWAKLKPETITSGPLKATGSPMRDLTDEERAYLQRIVLQLHQQFVHAVAVGRNGKISEEEVRKLADGRVFTGEEAVSLKLADRIGNLDDAVRVAGEMAGIKGQPATIYPHRREPTLIDLLGGQSHAGSLIERIVDSRAARFLYRW